MKQLVILSGKGGTGKTTVAASLIQLMNDRAYADCDVDAPNLHIALENAPFSTQTEKRTIVENYYGSHKAVKYEELCIDCGKCEELCSFGAIRDGRVNSLECEGCGVCESFCPSADSEGKKAIRLEENVSGQTRLVKEKHHIFSEAELYMGNGASGKLVTKVRRNLYDSLEDQGLVIIDGSPGIGCPVIASITGADAVLLVAEPTLSGLHDMERIEETARKFEAACFVCINKFDVNVENTKKIEEFCAQRDIPVVGRIPYDPGVIDAANAGMPVVTLDDSRAKDALIDIWQKVSYLLSM